MRVKRSDRFKKDYKKLPKEIQTETDEKIKLLLKDYRHPSLRIHKVRKVHGLWELSVTMNYRVIFEIADDEYILLGVGSHKVINQI